MRIPVLYWGANEEEMLQEVGTEYDGATVIGKDRGVY